MREFNNDYLSVKDFNYEKSRNVFCGQDFYDDEDLAWAVRPSEFAATAELANPQWKFLKTKKFYLAEIFLK